MLEIVFFQNFKPFGVSDLLGERIPVFLINSRFACHVHRVHRSTHEVLKARIWLAATHYFESEIINKLITRIKEAIKSKTLEENILIKCSLLGYLWYAQSKIRFVFFVKQITKQKK